MANSGMPIDGGEAPKRGPGRPRRDEQTIRPDLNAAEERVMRPSVPQSVKDAEEYAQNIFDNYGEIIAQDDKFYVPVELIPEGWAYEWKAMEIVGKPNGYHMVAQKRLGWRPVDSTRHPELVPEDYTGPIVKDGLMLMEIPRKIQQFYQRKAQQEAHDQVSNADQKLYETPAHTAPREEFTEKFGRTLKKTIEPANPQDYTMVNQ